MREILISVDLFINIKRLYIIGEVMHYSSASGNFFLYRIQRIQKKNRLTLLQPKSHDYHVTEITKFNPLIIIIC
jgi:hypothetical protein